MEVALCWPHQTHRKGGKMSPYIEQHDRERGHRLLLRTENNKSISFYVNKSCCFLP